MKNQSGVLTKRSLAILLAMAIAIAMAVTAFIGWRPGNDAVVKPPEEIEDYLFWQAKDLTDFKLIGANSKTLGLNDLKGKWSFIFLVIHNAPMSVPSPWEYWGKRLSLLRKIR